MQRTSQLVCGIAIILLAGTVVSPLHAQSVTARALFAYPLRGQTPEQETADRAACHNWAVTQTGFDPTLVYAAQQAGVPMSAIVSATRGTCVPSYEHPCFPQGGIGEAQGKVGVRRLNELYAAYLRAGTVCLEARGYQVSE
jgi:hypothetical protein